MRYPTMDEVNAANDMQIRRWFRVLPYPIGEHQGKIRDTIDQRHSTLPPLSPEQDHLLRNGVALCPKS